MSTPTPNPGATSGDLTRVLVGLVAMFCTVVAAVVLVTLFSPAGTDTGPIITGLIGTMTTVVPVLLVLAKVRGVEQAQAATQERVQAADEKLDFLTNGGMDSKIRAALPEVLAPSVLRDDPETRAQLDADRAHREAGPTTSRKDQA